MKTTILGQEHLDCIVHAPSVFGGCSGMCLHMCLTKHMVVAMVQVLLLSRSGGEARCGSLREECISLQLLITFARLASVSFSQNLLAQGLCA